MAKTRVHPDQQEIPGAEQQAERIPAVHNAARRYMRERDARIAANAKEKDAHEHLLAKMTEHNLTQYVYGGIEVYVDSSRKCKVSGPEKDGDSEE